MANFNITPNMGLPNPIPGQDSGPDYADNLQSSLNIIDQHNHTSGNGIQITPAGLNINADLPFGSNSIVSLKSAVFTQQISLSTPNAAFVGTDGNLYFNDGNGNPSIQITAGGLVNATSSGISSGSATASFVSSVLVVNAASNTPANIQGGSILIGNNVAASKFLTLSPPAALAANYTITFPLAPAVQNIVTLDAAGNLAAVWNVDGSTINISANNLQVANGGITQAKLASNSVGTAQIIDASVTLPKLAALSYQLSSSCGSFGTSSTGFVAVTNLSISFTCTGRPVFLALVGDGTGSSSTFEADAAGNQSSATVSLRRAGVSIAQYDAGMATSVASTAAISVPGTCIQTIDFPGAGTFTYDVQIKTNIASNTTFLRNVKLLAYEP